MKKVRRFSTAQVQETNRKLVKRRGNSVTFSKEEKEVLRLMGRVEQSPTARREMIRKSMNKAWATVRRSS